MLLESLEADELETKFLAVTGQQKVENIKNSLLKLTKAELAPDCRVIAYNYRVGL